MVDDVQEEQSLIEVPASVILAKIEKGEPVNYQYIKIIGNLVISELNLPKRKVYIDKSMDEIDISEFIELTEVSSSVRISNSQIKDVLVFDNCAFKQYITFDDTIFLQEAFFSYCIFSKPIHFNACIFKSSVDFYGSKLTEPSFFRAHFMRNADFSNCEFRHHKYVNVNPKPSSETLYSGRRIRRIGFSSASSTSSAPASRPYFLLWPS